MVSKDNNPDDPSVAELEEMLYRKKREARLARWRRMKEGGRIVDVAGLPPPAPKPPRLSRPRPQLTGALSQYTLQDAETTAPPSPSRGMRWRWIWNKLLLMVELLAIVGVISVGVLTWLTARELNQELALIQQSELATPIGPTATPAAVIAVVVLPSGHKPPVDGRLPEPGEAGFIPAHLQPLIENYQPPPIPTPGPEQARWLKIPAIGVDRPIVQGDNWEQLKKGVGQHVNATLPGQDGNMVMSAHNDIYGEIFRYLDKLQPGDEIIVSTERRSYTYVVRELQVVDPTDVWVMDNTTHASATLISCYPYLVNNKRIVVFADLASATP